MAAATVTFSKISTQPFRLMGGARFRVVRLTMVASTSTYTDGGIADSTNFGTHWATKLDMRKIDYVVPITPLRLSTFEKAYPFEIDITNKKLVLYGGATTAAEDVALEEIPNAGSITDGTYTATCLLIGA